MKGTMHDAPLSIARLLCHGSERHAAATLAAPDADHSLRSTRFDVIAGRCAALAHALTELGVTEGSTVGTLAGNRLEHCEALLAIPAMGAVAHPININLPMPSIISSIRQAADQVLLVDPNHLELAVTVASQVAEIRHLIVLGTVLPELSIAEHTEVHTLEALLDGRMTHYRWPLLDEHTAAIVAFTSGTTGEPKAVVYTHRSIWLHSMEMCMAESADLGSTDTVLTTVPLYHVMSWGLPYAAFMSGANVIFAHPRPPAPLPSGQEVAALLASQRPTKVATTPIVWFGVHQYLEAHPQNLDYLREILIGGSAVPPALFDAFSDRHGLRLIQAFGMTESSPLGAVARPDPRSSATARRQQMLSQGRFPAGVEARIVDGGGNRPADGSSPGELQIRGPWVTGSYLGDPEDSAERFDDGWLRTGDVATLSPGGYLTILDRVEDVILSGGEWISSVELENAVMLDARVAEAACIGVPDTRWGSRPLVLVTVKPGVAVTARNLWEGLSSSVDLWKKPDHWAFVEEIPRTSVGKFDKRAIRARHAAGEYTITTITPSTGR